MTRVKSGGGDTPDNVAPLCRKHHDEIHSGLGKFLKRYPVFMSWLQEHNRWDLIDKLDRLPNL